MLLVVQNITGGFARYFRAKPPHTYNTLPTGHATHTDEFSLRLVSFSPVQKNSYMIYAYYISCVVFF